MHQNQQQQQQQQSSTVVPPTYMYPVQQQYPIQAQIITQQPQYVVRDQGCCSGRREKYPAKWGVLMGSMLLTAGILCIVFCIAAIAVKASVTMFGHGIWTGIFFIITGSLTVGAGKGKHTGLIISSMVLAIICCGFFVPSLLTGSSIGLAIDANDCIHDHWHDEFRHKDCDAGAGINGVQLGLSLVILVLSIGISILGCLGLCRSQGSTGHVIVPQPIQMTAGPSQHPGMSVGQQFQYQAQGDAAPSGGNEKEQLPPPYTSQEDVRGNAEKL